MADLAKAAATAKRLIEANGRAVTLYKLNTTPDDPGKPWRGTTGPPTVPEGGLTIPDVLVAFVPASGSGFGKMLKDESGSFAKDEKGSLVVAYDQICLLGTDSLPAGITADDVEDCDSILDGTAAGVSHVWKIVRKGHLRPASQSVMFVLGVKR